MGHWRHKIILFSLIFTACFCYSNGCTVEGTFPPLLSHVSIEDVYRGTFWQQRTTGIVDLNSLGLGEVTGNRPYISAAVIDSVFELATTALFEQYEENEVSQFMIISVTFICTGGAISSPPLPIMIDVIDTNNNPPTFILPPAGEYVFTIAAPVPPGFEITGCLYDLIVRDIDLTTQKIIFEIDDNPYFEVEREIHANPDTPKEFKAIIRTKTFIRSIPEPIRLTIFATDSDLTGDPPRTKETTITIIGNADFVLPEEPVFTETFYLADYTDDNRVVLTEPIALSSGYDRFVQFNIEGDYDNFELVQNPDQENQISIRVVTPLEGDVLRESNIHLIVTADREHTSGASATVVLRLPEVVPLEFERAHYEGTIENNYLLVPQLILSQGYGGATVSATVINEYSTYFIANVQGNTVTLSMRSLEENIINENTYLSLEIFATNGLSTTRAIVTLEIIKDDNVTPVFNKPIYIGSYDPTGLTLEQIVLVQGHDGIDAVDLYGDYSEYFKGKLNGATVRIEVSDPIPPEIYSRERIILSLEVEKPRTVGASATIIINLPAARQLKFGASTHRGRLQDNVLTLDPIPLTVGYDSSVVFTITGDYADYFRVTNDQNPTVITLARPIPDGVILENNVVILTLTASGLNALATTTSVLLDIIKDDTTTPVFSKNIYYGTYLGSSNFNINDIYLLQGFDSTVTFSLDGDHAQFFDITNNGNEVIVFPRSAIPEDVIFTEKVLVFNVLAEKAFSVGASAAISISFPSDLTDRVIMKFSQNTYTGTIGSSGLTADSIVLSTGYAPDTEFILTGEYFEHFTLTPNNNVVSLSLSNPLPIEASENTFIVLEIEARRERAVSDWTSVVIDIIRQEIIPPVFTQAYYRGTYNAESGLQFNQVISLMYGYDETVSFSLDGEFTSLFSLDTRGTNSLSIVASAPISNEILQANNQILLTVVATKPGALTARSAVSIDIEKDLIVMRFSQNTYTGTIESSVLTADSIVLSTGYAPGTEFNLTGDYFEYFTLTPNNNVVSLSLSTPLPIEASENTFIVLEIEARRVGAVSDWTSVVIDIIRQEVVSPVFTQAYYRGAYNAESGLQFNQIISLMYGYDETVSFSLDGEFTSLFSLDTRGTNSLSIVASAPISNEILQANNQILLTVVATKPGALTARSAVSIDIEKDLTDRVIMRFSQNTYTGTIESSVLTADSIVLSTGYAPGTEFILTGDYFEYFTLTPNNNVVSLSLSTPLPIEASENTFIVLEIEARRVGAVSDWTSVVIDIIRQEVVSPVFTQAYYRGAYNAESGLQFNQIISLMYGYDETVSFSLDGEFTSLFSLDTRGTNSLSIVASAPISNEILQANNQILLTVVATKPGALTARSAVSIDIEKDLTDRVIMRFSQNTYTGTIESSVLTADSIVLSTGYAPGTEFILTGEYFEYFTLTPNNNVVSLSLSTPLPIEASENTFIVLEIEARRVGAVSDWTSVVIDIIRQEVVSPVFTQAYYRGAYNAESGLQFNQIISLMYGYDETVSFSLDGEFTSLFSLDTRGTNSLSIVASAPISNEILQANNQILLTVVATKPGALTARSAVSIDIEKDLTDRVIMRFSQNTYTGTIESSVLTVDSIVLSTGYAPGTEFILTGDYFEYFTLTPNNNGVSLSLSNPLPIEASENTFIVLEIEARRVGAVSDWTSVVIDIIRQEVVSPVFTQAYYRGAYNAESGLQFNQIISLMYGYDETVSFSLDGEFTSLFSLDTRGTNSLSIVASAPISNEILQANNQILLTVVATKPGALTARSAVSIDIEKDLTDRVIMRFSQNTYTGTIESSVLTADSIVLSTGYAPGTEFILTGDYFEYFTLTPNNNVVSLSLSTPLPIEASENTFIVLEIEARRVGAVSDWTSVVIDIIRQEVVSPVFTQAYYRGAYNAESGLQFNQIISLMYGYDETVSFSLDGEFTSLFSLDTRGTNSLSIVASAPISNEILQANNQILLTVVATKPGALTARSAVSIDIEKDLTDRVIMRFSQNTYTGTIESSVLTADSIVLSTGYAPGTEFILTGDYFEYFTLTPNNNVVSLSLSTPLPIEASENTFIVLEIEARRVGAVSDWTSVVIDIIRQEVVSPVFTQAYYRGAYNAESGLQFNQIISLMYGYDETVSFSLDGEFTSLFSLDTRGTNSLSIVASAPISNEILQANNQILLTVVATKPGALTARSAVSIDIEKDLTDRVIMRFSQNTYTGTIESSVLTADSIVLSTGYAPGTEFILTGDYFEYFTLTPNNNVVSLSLSTPLPIEASENTFIVLEIEARRVGAVSDWTSVVIDIIRQEVVSPVFTQAYYRGAYNAESGLQFNQIISLMYGYDETVSFSLDGEFTSLFSLDTRGTNSLSIVASAPISNEILQANNQILLTVVATKPGALTARSAVSIDIEKDLTDRVIMRFSQNTYTGTIESSVLTADSIVLSTGYAPGTEFILTGDYFEYFTLTPNNIVVSLSLSTPLPIEASENTFIVLEIEARRVGAVSDWTSVVIDIIRQEVVSPVFTQAYYRGAYNAESGLQFNQIISLMYGYDETVSFSLDGEFTSLFSLDTRGTNSLSIVASAPISNEILQANNQILLTVVATKPGALTARSAVSIDIEKDLTDRVIMRFSQNTYTGTIESSVLTADSIVLSTGYAPGTEFILTGDYFEYFTLTPNNNVVSLSLSTPLPIEASENTFIVLEIEARRVGAVSDWTSVVIDIIRQEVVSPVFTQAYYRGAYNAESGLQFNQIISLMYGYDETVSFSLDGEFTSLFSLDTRGTNSLSIVASAPISNEILQANNQILLTVVATKPGALTARSAVSIDIEKDLTDRVIMRFSQNTYTGTIESSVLTADSIVLSTGYAPGTEFILTGDYFEYFTLTPNNNVVSLSLSTPLPIEASENTFIVLEIEARRVGAVSDWTSVVIDIIRQEVVSPVFTQAYYRGAYNAESGLQFNQIISLMYGYDETVSFSLDGEFTSLFSLDTRGTNSLSIVASAPISNEILQANNQILLTVVVTKPGALTARSVVSIDIEKDLTDRVIMRFSQNTYTGTIESSVLTADSIVLSTGYAPGTEFILTGDYFEYFTLTPNNNVVSLSLSNPLPIEASENTFIVLEIEARRVGAVSDWTSVVIDIIRQEVVSPVFTQAYYRGAYNAESGLQFNQKISLMYGYDETVSFSLDGEFTSLFSLDTRGTNSLSIVASAPISNEILQANNQILLTVVATKPGALTARSAVSIDIEKDSQSGADVSFERVLYQGVIQLDEIRHELITITGYDETSVVVVGAYSSLFEGQVSDGVVRVQAAGSLALPAEVTNLALELHAAHARTVLLLEVVESGVPLEPTVTFSSESYVLSVDITQTGLVGRVSATADNSEEVIYSLGTDDAHLQTRLSISEEGELHLSAPANSGLYIFQVIATTVITRASGTASVHLTVQAITVCDDQGIQMAPLIVLDRNEESAHSNLVVLDSMIHAGCHFTLTNRWPTNQPWLYVDENGLHTIPIDREHASIAFMALSQVQVELILHCETDGAKRKKRSERTERLGPYDYGSNKWILTDTIPFNARRSLVNLIVNDINDNHPIFIGKEREPIAVGYPTGELEERILPRSLTELKATDADIGENAALRYSSSESVLAVAPLTGFVHVRTGAQLQQNQLLTVTATDENGQGLEGTIQLVVKLLDLNHIAVVTVRDAFLDDETTVLAQLSDSVGYEVKTLRSVVISDDIDEGVSRNKRETGTPKASLQLYVYGINEREPVPVDQLAADINTNGALASVVSTIPLEDHLGDMDILDRQIGLLVATIILSVLLFAVILLVAIWFFLRWRRNKNYEEFNEENSLASRNASLGELPKPEAVPPRLNIEDLKRSEKRLQEMLRAPVQEITVEPMTRKTEAPVDAILDLPIIEPSAPIVIQSIDKLKNADDSSDDEFGEVSTNRRKSVVTFNENVEKIIHVEDNIDEDGDDDVDVEANVNVDASNSGFEIYRL